MIHSRFVGTMILSKGRRPLIGTNYFKYRFFNRYVSVWNSLPSNVICESSLDSFKVSLLS